MSKQKTINPGQKKQNKIQQTVPETKNFATAAVFKRDKKFDYILIGLILAYFLFYFFKLYSSLGNTFFWADENVHAYISSIILKTRSLPAVLPEDIYGGFEYSYPPLFHIFGAIVMSIAGFSALKFTNLILLIFFLAGFYFLIRAYCGNSAALLASLLISLSPTIAMNAIRFMTEMLSMALVFFSFIFLATAIKKSNHCYAIMSGLSTGLLLLSKQLGIVVLGFYFLLLIWFFFNHKPDVRLILYVIGASACIFIPYLIWAVYNGIGIFGFLSVFSGTKAEWAASAVKSFRRYDSSLKEFSYLFYLGNGFVICISLLVPLYHFVRTRAKDRPQNYGFILLVYLAAAMIIWHITNQRHTITLIPLLAFLFGYALQQIITNKTVMRVLILFLAIIAGYSTFQMPNYRRSYNAPEEFLELTKIIKNDDVSKGKTLAVYAFDTVIYTGKPAIWPYPNLRTIPINLFENQTPSSLFDLLKYYKIDYILIDFQMVTNLDTFMGRNYPISFVRNCETLTRKGKLSFQALSKSKQFLLLKVS